ADEDLRGHLRDPAAHHLRPSARQAGKMSGVPIVRLAPDKRDGRAVDEGPGAQAPSPHWGEGSGEGVTITRLVPAPLTRPLRGRPLRIGERCRLLPGRSEAGPDRAIARSP